MTEKTSSFEFAAARRVLFGRGRLSEAFAIARGFGSRALVVTGLSALGGTSDAGGSGPGADPIGGGSFVRPGPPATPGSAYLRLQKGLHDAGVAAVHQIVRGEPTTTAVDEGARLALASGCDLVVGLGGGSVLDAAKAVAGLMTNGGEVLDYLEVVGRGLPLEQPATPFIAIPTTAGTGSEVTRNAVLAEPGSRVKASMRSPHLLPAVALVDPALTDALPPALTAVTGLDALTQLIEAYLTPRANPVTDALTRSGIRRSARSLLRAVHGAPSPRARDDLALASLFGGFALANAGLGAVHGIAAPLGGRHPVPHGVACAVLLPHVFRANLRALRRRAPGNPALGRMALIGRLLARHGRMADGTPLLREGEDPRDGPDLAAALLVRLVETCRVPALGSFGVKTSDVREIVDAALRASSMKANPVPLEAEELAEALEAAL